ncbi:MAG: amidohydrolase family protein [Gemmatimonadetes bacterium]|nr:amidohydrolase family protein [Gemmatimonadota bacterium]
MSVRTSSVLVALAQLAVPALAQRPALGPQVTNYVTVSEPSVALTNVRLIDGTGRPAVDGQTIVITGGRIVAVGRTGSVAIPAGARVIDYPGHTVIPGLVGMHNHIHYSAAGWRNINLAYSSPRLYLASGVTTIRATGSLAPYEDMNLKRDIDAGRTPGPRIHLSGPYITGANPALGVMSVLQSEEEARRTVRYWAQEGATWFKLYTTIRRAEMRAAVDEAHKHGLKITGHLCSIGFKEAVELGIDNLEHGLFVNTEYDPAKTADQCPATNIGLMETLDLNSPEVQSTFRAMIDRGVSMTSTLPVIEALVPGRPKDIDPRTLELMYPAIREAYLAQYNAGKANPRGGVSEKAYQKALAYEYAFAKAGGLLAAGVDNTGNGGALAGIGDQRNLEILVEAGFTPTEAFRIMSLNGAKILGVDKELGSVEVGKLADFAVVRGNPAERPADIRNTVVVFKDGVGYDPERLYASVRGQVGLR